MAFTLNTFQFNRGILTCAANGSGISTVTHGYKSNDTNATINTPGYFPDDAEVWKDKVFVDDLICITSSDSTTMVRITSLSPFAYGADLFSNAGAPLVMGAPVAATDGNGAKITGTTLQLEFADGTQPGILSVASQAITGNKTFNNLVMADGGVRFFGNTSTLSFYEAQQIVLTFTNGAENSGNTDWLITRMGNLVTISSIGFVTTASQVAPGTQFISDTPLPSEFIPTSAGVFNGLATISNGGATSAGLVNIDSTGVLRIYNDFDKTTPFTTLDINGFISASITFSRG